MAAPSVPTNLAAAGEYQDIRLTWTASTGTVDAYMIYVLTGTVYVYVGSTTDEFYVDSPLADGVTKYYKISAIYETDESDQTDAVYATTLTQTVAFNNSILFAKGAVKVLSFDLSGSSSYALTNYINPRYSVIGIFAGYKATTNTSATTYIICDNTAKTVKVYDAGALSEAAFSLTVLVYCV